MKSATQAGEAFGLSPTDEEKAKELPHSRARGKPLRVEDFRLRVLAVGVD
jgi:hypothetical protein